MSPLPPYEEKELLHALTQGTRAAYTTLYSRYLDSLLQYILLFTGSRETAEEIVQDVFLRIWEKRSALGEVESFKTNVVRAAKNQLINHINREKSRSCVTGRFLELSAL